MIKPHGSDKLNPRFVEDDQSRQEITDNSKSMPAVMISSAAAANAVMLGGGYFTPLDGYMNLADAVSVADNMHTSDGTFWPVPVLNIVEDRSGLSEGEWIALRDPNVTGAPVLAVQKIDRIEKASAAQLDYIANKVFGTLDNNHPGVSAFRSQGNKVISGQIRVLNYSYFETEFSDTFRTAVQIREQIRQLGWQKVVAFQTRNPMHRAHEELCKMAVEQIGADGVVIHMLLGKLKPGDIPAAVRDAAIRKMVEFYFPPNTVLVTGYGFDMLYAGPREAVLHALFRQNAGCTHFIVGRDHAGVGDYYEPFAAQEIFGSIPNGALEIEVFKADHTAYSKKLNKVVMMRDVSDHTIDDFVLLSGTKVREMLAQGIELPTEFARPEVAHILMEHYRNEAARTASISK